MVEETTCLWGPRYRSWLVQKLPFKSQTTGKNGCNYSNFPDVTIGISQGSEFGGLLFLTYINDIPQVSDQVFTALIADDTCIALSDWYLLVDTCRSVKRLDDLTH